MPPSASTPGQMAAGAALGLGIGGLAISAAAVGYHQTKDQNLRTTNEQLKQIIQDNQDLDNNTMEEFYGVDGDYSAPIVRMTASGRIDQIDNGRRVAILVPGSGLTGPVLDADHKSGTWAIMPSGIAEGEHELGTVIVTEHGAISAVNTPPAERLSSFGASSPLEVQMDQRHNAILSLEVVPDLLAGDHRQTEISFSDTGLVSTITSSSRGEQQAGLIVAPTSSVGVPFHTRMQSPLVRATSYYCGTCVARRPANVSEHGFFLESDIERHLVYSTPSSASADLLDARIAEDTGRLFLLVRETVSRKLCMQLQRQDGTRTFLPPAPLGVEADNAVFAHRFSEKSPFVVSTLGRDVQWIAPGKDPVHVATIGSIGSGNVSQLCVIDTDGLAPAIIAGNDSSTKLLTTSHADGSEGWEVADFGSGGPVFGLNSAWNSQSKGQNPGACVFFAPMGLDDDRLALHYSCLGFTAHSSPFAAIMMGSTRKSRASASFDAPSGKIVCSFVNPDDNHVHVDSWDAKDASDWTSHGLVTNNSITTSPHIVIHGKSKVTVAYLDSDSIAWCKTRDINSDMNFSHRQQSPLGENEKDGSSSFISSVVHLDAKGLQTLPEIIMTRLVSENNITVGYSPVVSTQWQAISE